MEKVFCSLRNRRTFFIQSASAGFSKEILEMTKYDKSQHLLDTPLSPHQRQGTLLALMSAKLPPNICLNKLPMYGVAEKCVWWWVCKPISLICFGPNQAFNCKERIYGDCLTGPLMMENVVEDRSQTSPRMYCKPT